LKWTVSIPLTQDAPDPLQYIDIANFLRPMPQLEGLLPEIAMGGGVKQILAGLKLA
jgi:hypothetical protein